MTTQKQELNPFAGIANDLLAENTLKAYKSDWRMWSIHCDTFGIRPLPIDVEEYCDWIAIDIDDISFSTLDRRIATAKSAHKFCNLNHLQFPLRLKVLKSRIVARRKVVKQAPPLLMKDLHLICETPAISVRDRALVSFMFDAMLRGQDAIYPYWSDLIVEQDEYGTRAYIKIHKTKGKYNADGELRALSRRTMLLLEEYHQSASKGFKKPSKDRIFPIKVRTVRQTFDTISEKIGKRYTTHSPRVGATVEMVENGISEVDICINAGWSSVDLVRRYARKISPKNGASTKLMNKIHESKWLDDVPAFLEFHK